MRATCDVIGVHVLLVDVLFVDEGDHVGGGVVVGEGGIGGGGCAGFVGKLLRVHRGSSRVIRAASDGEAELASDARAQGFLETKERPLSTVELRDLLVQ